MSQAVSQLSDTQNVPALPHGWVWTRLEEIGQINPKHIDRKLTDDMEVTFLPMKCVEELTGNLDLSLARRLSEVKKGYTPFVEGDLLFAKITPCMENGKVAVTHSLKNGIGFGSTEFHVIRLPETLPRKFFFFFLIREELRRDAQRNMTGSVGQLRVPSYYIEHLPLLLPPLPEQHRIVAKIEELFTRLDAGVETLNKVKTQLKHYRQAVLRDAFQGKLTQEWREAHKGELEPASKLLERIKEERRKNAESKLKEPPPLDTATLPELPEEWLWTRLGEVCFVQGGYAFKSKDYGNSGIPLLRISNISEGKVTFDGETVFLAIEYEEKYRDFLVMNGDIVIALSGATTGKFGIYDKKESALLNQRVGRLKYYCRDLVSILYLFYRMEVIRQDILKRAYGAAQPNISTDDLAEFEVPLAPLPEQHKIVEEIERRLSVADEIEKAIDQSLKQAGRLRQSILKTAFEGKLVPQDPADEPAERLLERIKEERARQQTEAKNTKGGKGKALDQARLLP